MPEQTPFPSSKAHLMELLAEGRKNIEGLIDTLNDELMTNPGPDGGWTIKDHVAHLAAWEVGIAALLKNKSRWEAMGLDTDPEKRGDEVAINATLESRMKHLSLAEVKDLFDRAHRQMLAALEPLTYDQLMLPYNHYDPEAARTEPVVNFIAGNTYQHWEEHEGWIREILKSQKP